ncbi:MAG TPA: MFS transporter [Burkholderiales bacterium]|nr:MFS transporter [Burkholderiales bacterium]
MVLAANFIAIAARMSLVTFLGIWFVREARIDLATVGVAFLVEHVLRGAASPMFGALSDRIGRRSLLIGAALASAVVLPCFLLVNGPATLMIWSVAMGLCGAINMPVGTALLLDLAPADRRQSTLALNYTVMSVAYTLGVSPAGYVAEQGYGLLALTASLGYLTVAGLYLMVLRGPLPLDRGEQKHLLVQTASVFRDRIFLAFAALAFVFPLSMGLVVSASPLFAADAGLGEGFIGLVLGLNSIIVAIFALPVASRIEASGPFRPLGAAALLVAACFACYAFVPQPAAALVAGTVVFSFGELVFSSAVPAAVARLAPAGRRGLYQGGWALVGSFSMGSALFVSGLLRDAVGWEGVWKVSALLAGMLAIILWLCRQRFLEASERVSH